MYFLDEPTPICNLFRLPSVETATHTYGSLEKSKPKTAAEPILPGAGGTKNPDSLIQDQLQLPSAQRSRVEACAMAAGGKDMTLASAKTFLEMSGADREAGDIVSAAGIDQSDPTFEQGYQGYSR